MITHPLHQPEAKNPACAVLLAPRCIHEATQASHSAESRGEPGSPLRQAAWRNQFNPGKPASPSRRCALVTQPAHRPDSDSRGCTNQFFKGAL